MALVGVAAAEPIAVELVSAERGYDQRTGEPVVTFRMSSASRTVFAQFTQQNVGRKFELRVDGQDSVGTGDPGADPGRLRSDQRQFHARAGPRYRRSPVLRAIDD